MYLIPFLAMLITLLAFVNLPALLRMLRALLTTLEARSGDIDLHETAPPARKARRLPPGWGG